MHELQPRVGQVDLVKELLAPIAIKGKAGVAAAETTISLEERRRADATDAAADTAQVMPLLDPRASPHATPPRSSLGRAAEHHGIDQLSAARGFNIVDDYWTVYN